MLLLLLLFLLLLFLFLLLLSCCSCCSYVFVVLVVLVVLVVPVLVLVLVLVFLFNVLVLVVQFHLLVNPFLPPRLTQLSSAVTTVGKSVIAGWSDHALKCTPCVPLGFVKYIYTHFCVKRFGNFLFYHIEDNKKLYFMRVYTTHSVGTTNIV